MAVCPAGAITHTKIPNKVPLKKTGKLPTHEAVVNLVESRRSVRVFKDEKVSEDAIAKLLDLVNYIPTGHASRTNIRIEIIQNKEILNKIPQVISQMLNFMRFVANMALPVLKMLVGKETAESLKRDFKYFDKQAERIKNGEDPILYKAPVLALIIGKKEYTANFEGAMAAYTIALTAPTLGLATCLNALITAAFDYACYSKISKIPGIPKFLDITKVIKIELKKGEKVMSAIVIGHPKVKYPYIPYREPFKVTNRR